MKPLAWIGLALLMLLSVSILGIGLSSNSSIRGLGHDKYTDAIVSIVGTYNNSYKTGSVSVQSIDYVGDYTALVRTTVDGLQPTVFFVFEYYDNTLYLTNYSSSPFGTNDFARSSSVTKSVIDISSEADSDE